MKKRLIHRRSLLSKVFSKYFNLACMLSHSVLSDSVIPWTVARQAPLSIGFPRQEYWSGSPFPSPGDLPDPGIEPTSPVLADDSFTIEPKSNSSLLY